MKISLLVIIVMLLPLSGCRDSAEHPFLGVDGVPDWDLIANDESELVRDDKPPRELSRDEMVIRNCYLVRDAAEEWSRENGGGYPGHPTGHPNDAGHTLVDFLPGGDYLGNPYTGQRNVPYYPFHDPLGSTDYLVVTEDWVGVVGYMIRGWGEAGQLVQILQNFPDSLVDLDSIVVANCVTVQRAVERFAAENDGEYPANLADETPLGNNVIDLLPGSRNLRNPYYSLRSEPIDGAAAAHGATGYTPWALGGEYVGYCITGTGTPGDTIVEITKDPNAEDPYRATRVTVRRRNQ